MSNTSMQHTEFDIALGDRVQIQPGLRIQPTLVGQAGMVVEVFRLPLDSCLVRIAGDPNRQRTWFFYRDELVVTNV